MLSPVLVYANYHQEFEHQHLTVSLWIQKLALVCLTFTVRIDFAQRQNTSVKCNLHTLRGGKKSLVLLSKTLIYLCNGDLGLVSLQLKTHSHTKMKLNL